MEFVYIVLLILLLVWLQRLLYEKRAFRRFRYSCRFSTDEATEGEEIRLVETVENGKPLPLPWLRSEITTSAWLDYAGSQSMVTDETRFVSGYFTMRGMSRTTRSWNVRCRKRGIYQIQKCVLLSTDLFGLRSFSYPVKTDARVTVLPRPADLQADFTSARQLSGDIVVRRRYLPDPFAIAGVRPYTERDPLNRIHWRATARSGVLMVHNNEDTADQNLLILLNLQSRPFETAEVADKYKSENAIRVAAGFISDTIRSGIPVRLAVNASADAADATVTNAFSGPEHVQELMRVLAALPIRTTMPFTDFLTVRCDRLDASDLVIVTPYLDENTLRFARERQSRGTEIRIALAAPTELELPGDLPVFVYKGEGAAE